MAAIVFERVNGRLQSVAMVRLIVAKCDELATTKPKDEKPKHQINISPERSPMGTRYGSRGAEKKRMLQLA